MGHDCLKADTTLFAYALATTVSGLLARGEVIQGQFYGVGSTAVSYGQDRATGHVGTGVEGLMFLVWAPQLVRPQPSPRRRRRSITSSSSATQAPRLRTHAAQHQRLAGLVVVHTSTMVRTRSSPESVEEKKE